MRIISDMLEDWVGRFLLLTIILLIVSIPFIIHAAIKDERQWQEFKVAHKCKVVGMKKGYSSTTVIPVIGGNGGVGFGVTSVPDQTAWECDNGITYWR